MWISLVRNFRGYLGNEIRKTFCLQEMLDANPRALYFSIAYSVVQFGFNKFFWWFTVISQEKRIAIKVLSEPAPKVDCASGEGSTPARVSSFVSAKRLVARLVEILGCMSGKSIKSGVGVGNHFSFPRSCAKYFIFFNAGFASDFIADLSDRLFCAFRRFLFRTKSCWLCQYEK